MNSANSHFCGGGTSGVFPVSAFSAFSLLRNYNYLLTSEPSDTSKHFPLPRITECSLPSAVSDDISPVPRLENEKTFPNFHHNYIIPTQNIFGYRHSANPLQRESQSNLSNTLLPPCPPLLPQNFRRQRGEKKPIPDEQKDDKYFERRKRNNQAAKKSRDARKMREDQIALRATLLEHENAILKAQILTLREEASSLRQMVLQKKTLEITSPKDTPLRNS